MQATNRKWYGDKLWYLLNLNPEELRAVFPEQTWDNLKNKRKMYRKQIKNGEEPYPTKPKDYRLNDTPEIIRDRLNKVKQFRESEVNELLVNESTRQRLHVLLDETLDKANVNPASVKNFRINAGSHVGYIKDSNNEIEYTNELPKQTISLLVEPERFVKKWEPINAAATAPIVAIKPIKNTRPKNQKVCVVIPDPQIGFLRYVDGSLEPFHDDNAISIALQIIADLQPDKVVCLGDYLDLPMFGTYEQSENYAHTCQPAIDYGYRLLATIRASVPNAEIAVLEGNHDRRIEKNIQRSNMAAWGIKRADDIEGWPVFSVPFLCRFDDLNVKYVEGYPAGKYWINERLQCIHGHIVGPPGQTAAKVVKAETVSTLFGHIHRIETAYDTQNVYNGARANMAHSPGCLCRIDGGVPSAKGSTDLNGRPIRSFENWQQGLAVVDYEEGDAPFSVHSIYINSLQNYYTTYNNKGYLPDKNLIAELNKK